MAPLHAVEQGNRLLEVVLKALEIQGLKLDDLIRSRSERRHQRGGFDWSGATSSFLSIFEEISGRFLDQLSIKEWEKFEPSYDDLKDTKNELPCAGTPQWVKRVCR